MPVPLGYLKGFACDHWALLLYVKCCCFFTFCLKPFKRTCHSYISTTPHFCSNRMRLFAMWFESIHFVWAQKAPQMYLFQVSEHLYEYSCKYSVSVQPFWKLFNSSGCAGCLIPRLRSVVQSAGISDVGTSRSNPSA